MSMVKKHDLLASVPDCLSLDGTRRPAFDGATFDVLDPATEYGLVAYVFTGSLARGQRTIERLRPG